MVHARAIVKALHVRAGDELEQVLIALLVLRQRHQVVGVRVQLGVFVGHGARGDIQLAADDGVDAIVLGRVGEIDRAIHHAMVREGDGGRARVVSAMAKAS